MGHLLFDSVEAFQEAFAPHAQAIVGDIPNYALMPDGAPCGTTYFYRELGTAAG